MSPSIFRTTMVIERGQCVLLPRLLASDGLFMANAYLLHILV